jgi:hypothetical protein
MLPDIISCIIVNLFTSPATKIIYYFLFFKIFYELNKILVGYKAIDYFECLHSFQSPNWMGLLFVKLFYECCNVLPRICNVTSTFHLVLSQGPTPVPSVGSSADRVPLRWLLLHDLASLPQPKPKRSSYEWFIPKGILKTNW